MPPSPPAKPNDDAFLALTANGTWVNNADTKIGFLATATTVLTVAVVRQRHRVETLLDAGLHARGVVALILLAVCVLCLGAAAFWLFEALRPRLTNVETTRFAFPHLATAEVDDLMAYDPQQVRREAWLQAKTLATIACGKYRRFYNALRCGVGAGAAFLAFLLVVPTP